VKTRILTGLCLMFALALLATSPAAQPVPADSLMAGAGIETPCEKFLEALTKSDVAGMHSQLATWKQNALKLSWARMQKRFADGKLTEEQVKAWLAKQDPSAKSGVTTWEQLKAAKHEQFFALSAGLWTLPSRSAATWLMVEKAVGLREPGDARIIAWGGALDYETDTGDKAVFTLAVDGDKWVVVDFALQLGVAKANLGAALRRELGGKRVWSSLEKTKISEGEILLGAARDFCRVEYSKTGSADRVTKRFNQESADGAFEGTYFNVSEYIKELPASDYDAAVIAEPQEDGLPFVMMLFKWASGNSTIEWLDDRDTLNERIAELTEETE
jgi:hypothetical protein